MKRHEPDDFLKEVMADEALDALRENSLAGGLAALQGRRRRKAAARAAIVAGAAVVLLSVIFLRPGQKVSAPVAPVVVAAATTRPTIKIYPPTVAGEMPPIPKISDEELLALFQNQSVALFGKAGQQKLAVFAPRKLAAQ